MSYFGCSWAPDLYVFAQLHVLKFIVAVFVNQPVIGNFAKLRSFAYKDASIGQSGYHIKVVRFDVVPVTIGENEAFVRVPWRPVGSASALLRHSPARAGHT